MLTPIRSWTRVALLVGLAIGLVNTSYGAGTSASLNGRVLSIDGSAISGALVTIQHEPSGTKAEARSNDNGVFFQGGLRVGGPYTVTVSSSAHRTIQLDGLQFSAGAQQPMVLQMQSDSVEEVVVTAARIISARDLNNGVGSVYTADDIANQPSFDRDAIKTILKDPLAHSGGTGNLSVAGVNPRFNGLSIDGSLQQDDFGLSDNTYATNRSPINLDAIESVSLVASDYSVEGTGYTGGLVNITTKSGSNEFSGSVFGFFTKDSMIGDEYDGDRAFNPGDFSEDEIGFTIGGPIIEDELFFFLSLDRFESTSTVDFSNSDSNNGIQPGFFEAFQQLMIDTYNFDPGVRPQVASTPETTDRVLAKFDWNLTESHRLAFTYQDTQESDSSASATSLPSAWIDYPIDLTSYTTQLYSDWNDSFSTSMRFNVKDFARGQICRAGPGIGHLGLNSINADDAVGTPLEGLITDEVDLLAGCDRFRHANDYSDTRTQFFISGDYLLDQHILKVGYEYENFDLFNLFVPASAGRFEFDDLNDLIAGTARIDYVNVPSNVATDGAAEWGYSKHTIFAQDSVQIGDVVELTFGARLESYAQDDKPAYSSSIDGKFGTRTDQNLDGLSLFMPRVSFRTTGLDQWVISGGMGLFAGGDPKVWTSNAFQVPTSFARVYGTNVNPRQVPQELIDQVAASGSGTPIDAIDPDFEVPSDWKFSIRAEYDVEGMAVLDGSVLTVQYLNSRPNNGFGWRNIAHTELAETQPLGVAPDGRPIYADLDDLDLSNLTLLTNFTGGSSQTLSFAWSKNFENGIDAAVSYAIQDVTAVSEGVSSRGISNWRNIMSTDRNNPDPRTSPYEVSNAIKASFGYERDIFGSTGRIDMFARRATGSRYAYTFDVWWRNPLFGRAGLGEGPYDNDPLYVPSSPSDPLVVFDSSVDVDAFFDYVEENGISSGIQEPFGFNADASTLIDLRLQWEVPTSSFVGFLEDSSAKVVFDIENVLNFLNSDWGVFHTGPRYRAVGIIQSDLVTKADVAVNGVDGATALTGDDPRLACLTQDSCVYRFTDFDADTASFTSASRSIYQIKLGIRFDF